MLAPNPNPHWQDWMHPRFRLELNLWGLDDRYALNIQVGRFQLTLWRRACPVLAVTMARCGRQPAGDRNDWALWTLEERILCGSVIPCFEYWHY